MKKYIAPSALIILGIVSLIGFTVFFGSKYETAGKIQSVESLAVMQNGGINETASEIKTEAKTEADSPPAVSFSLADTFYGEDIEVEFFSSIPGADIYYTLDGSPPDTTKTRYTEPLKIKAEAVSRAFTIKAATVKDGKISEAVTKSYIVGLDVWERFTPGTFVFVLSADPYDLYDYYNGIAVEGFLRDQYKKEINWRRGNIDPPNPANYNIRGIAGERNFFVEVYNNKGETLIQQAAAGRVSGAWSRANEQQKSWRLVARKEYGKGKFNFPFFSDSFDSNGRLVTSFDRLTLRNNANDRTDAALRDELVSRLSKQAGFLDTQSFAPAAVFLNSKYYGFSWLKENYNRGHLELRYGGIKDNYEIVEMGEIGNKGEPRAVTDWARIYRLAQTAVDRGAGSGRGFDDDVLWDIFASRVDIDNLMLYYAIEIYIDNRDWPNNNMRMWRYFPSEGEIITNPYNDGKWRFLMYDTEFSLGIYGSDYTANTLETELSENSISMSGPSTILKAALQRDDMKERFVNTTCDLISGAFSYERFSAVISELSELGDNELSHAIKAKVIDRFNFTKNRQRILDFAKNRGKAVYSQIVKIFKIPADKFNVSLTGAPGSEAWLNTRCIYGGESIQTTYFRQYEIPIKAVPSADYEFVSWEINGKVYYEKEMKINASMADGGGNVKIKLNVNKTIN